MYLYQPSSALNKMIHIFCSGIDRYVKEGLNWVTNALEKQLDVHGMGHGLNAGALLICGRSKSGNSGCGITSIAKEICRKAIDYPLLAHVIIVECAEHRGRAPHFKDVLLEKLSEARWFQPSIVLLDDVDHIAPSVHYGQHEHGSEAFQANRMAERKLYCIKGILLKIGMRQYMGL